jgi:hypothetical protein
MKINTYFLSIIVEPRKREEFKVIKQSSSLRKLKKKNIVVYKAKHNIWVDTKDYGLGYYENEFHLYFVDENIHISNQNFNFIISLFSLTKSFKKKNLLMRTNHNVFLNLQDLVHFP